jgi:hypothetical protein
MDNSTYFHGKKVLIRTVTNYYTGQVEGATEQFIILSGAAWIADTGRFHTALATGKLEEVEPYPDRCWVALGAIVDICEWNHELPRAAR